jgi:hypothetical protein
MFSDEYRIFKIILPLLLIILLIIYANIKGPIVYPGYQEAKNHPRQFVGKKINFGGKIIRVENNYFIVEIDKKPVKARGVLPKNQVGYLITGNALYQTDGSLKALQYHTSNLRNYKIIISIIPIIFITYLFIKEYRFDKKTLTFKKVKNF